MPLPIAGQVPVNSPMFQAYAQRQAGNPLFAALLERQNQQQIAGQQLQAGGQFSPAQPSLTASPATPQPTAAAPAEQPGLLSRIGQGVKDFTGDKDRMAALVLGLNSMRLKPSAGIASAANNQLLQSRAAKQREAREARAAEQAGEQANRTAAYFSDNGREDLAKFIDANPHAANAVVQSFIQAQAQPGKSFLPMTGEQLRKMGYAGVGDGLYNFNVASGEIKATGGGGPTVNVNTGGPDRFGPIKANYMVVDDPDAPGGVRMQPMAGSPEALAAENRARKGLVTDNRITQMTGKIREGINNPTFNFGNDVGRATWRIIGSALPGTAEADLKADITALQSNIAFQELSEMRQSSPTGGAVGALTDREREAIAALRGMLQLGISDKSINWTLDNIEREMFTLQHGSPEDVQRVMQLQPGAIAPEVYDSYLREYRRIYGEPVKPYPGEVRSGYRYLGGDPSDRNSWAKAQ